MVLILNEWDWSEARLEPPSPQLTRAKLATADPSEIHPAWLGYSIGRWNAETFIVETIGINDRTWLDDSGYPHSDALRSTQRMRRVYFGRLEIEFTFADPKT